MCVCVCLYACMHFRDVDSAFQNREKRARDSGGTRVDARRKEEEKTTDPGDDPEIVLERGGLKRGFAV